MARLKTGNNVLLPKVVAILENAKAVDVRTYDLTGRSIVTDAVVVVTGEANRHLEAMGEQLRVSFKSQPRHAIEGSGDSGWVLVDLGDVVVHLMTGEQRTHFDLDSIYEQVTAS